VEKDSVIIRTVQSGIIRPRQLPMTDALAKTIRDLFIISIMPWTQVVWLYAIGNYGAKPAILQHEVLAVVDADHNLRLIGSSINSIQHERSCKALQVPITTERRHQLCLRARAYHGGFRYQELQEQDRCRPFGRDKRVLHVVTARGCRVVGHAAGVGCFTGSAHQSRIRGVSAP
jgi:hypothetical protein